MRRLCCYCYTSSGFPRPTAPYPASVRYSGHQNYHKNEVSVRGATRIYGYPYCLRCGWKSDSLLHLPALTNKMLVLDILVGRSCQSRRTTFGVVHFLDSDNVIEGVLLRCYTRRDQGKVPHASSTLYLLRVVTVVTSVTIVPKSSRLDSTC